MKRFVASTILFFAAVNDVYGYKEEVHKRITANVFARLKTDFRSQLGVDRVTVVGGKTLEKWLQEGAFDEDDTILTKSIIQRPVNHFFDPIHEVPLSIGVYPACGPAVLTFPLLPALATRADTWSGAHGSQFLNSYEITDARDLQRLALLGPNPGTRDVGLKELFYALGHVVHLVEDMAQPEHTRNDQHLAGSHLFLGNGTAASLYEEWGMQNLAGIVTMPPGETPPCSPCPPLVDFEGYPTVKLPNYASYFHTPEKDGFGRSFGRGMADFSNRNFVTQDTNYGDYDGTDRPCYDFPEPVKPVIKRDQWTQRSALKPEGTCCELIDVHETIYESPMRDTLTGANDVDMFHAFESSMDIETSKVDPTAKLYSLADESYQTRAAMLIPRAIGYAAGIVEHFFRGQIAAEWKDVGGGAYDLKITNLSQQAIGKDASLSAIFRATPGYFNRTNHDDTGGIVWRVPLVELVEDFDGLSPGEGISLTVTPFGLKSTDSILNFERRIVIEGALGDEPLAVIGLVQAKQTSALRVEVTACQPVCPELLELTTNNGQWLLAGYGTAPWSCGSATPPTGGGLVPNACVEQQATPRTPPWAFVFKSVQPGVRYEFKAYIPMATGFEIYPYADLTYRVLVDGQLMQQKTDRFFLTDPSYSVIMPVFFHYP